MLVDPDLERIQKILSRWGIASRRQAEQMILDGRVSLNGRIAQLGQKVDLKKDRLEVDGKLIDSKNRPQLVYLLLHKPAGVVSTCHDPQKRPTVIELLPACLGKGQGIHPVGRLDADSTGALLLTNDGDLTLALTHPRYHLPKVYQVWVQGKPSESILKKWRNGVILSGKKTLPSQVKVVEQSAKKTLLKVVLHEGRNRQIRRVAEQLGFGVLSLHRTAIGSIQLQSPQKPVLPRGKYRFLDNDEINSLRRQIHPEKLNLPADTKENRK